MGLFDFLRKSGCGDQAMTSSAHESPITTIAATIAQLDEDHWATFTARHGPSEAIIVEVAGPPDYSINTGLDEVDLPAIARGIGLTALAESIARGGKHGHDATLHVANGASTAELAELVNAIFTVHHKLPPTYAVNGELQH